MTTQTIFQPKLPVSPHEKISWNNLPGSSVGLALSSAITAANRPLLIIASDSLYASHLLDELRFFNHDKDPIVFFPDWETLPYDHFSPHQDIISDRLLTLSQLPTLKRGAIITTIATIMHRLPPKSYIDQYSFILKTGDHLNIDVLRTKLTHGGYRTVSQVREHGEFAIRGSIVDLFPMGSDAPFRIDLFDNEVETIRLFAPDTQRSLEKIEEIRLLPAKEFPMTEDAIEKFRSAWRNAFQGNPVKCPAYQDISDGICTPGIEYYSPLFFDDMLQIFDYLPKNILTATIGNIQTSSAEFWQEIHSRYEQMQHDTFRPILEPQRLFINPAECLANIKSAAWIEINNTDATEQSTFNTSAMPSLDIDYKSPQPLKLVEDFVGNFSGRILFCAESMGRREVLLQLFQQTKLHPTYFPSFDAFLASNEKIGIVVTPIEHGFILQTPNIALITETHLYGKRVMQRRLRKRSTQDPGNIIRDLTEMQIGDAVVHIDHGIGRYQGLQTLTVGDQTSEFLCLEYLDQSKLYVPVASLNLISRYSGTDPEHVPISRLGTEQWQRAKRKAAEKVRDAAAELLELYAKRAAQPGHVYDFPAEQYASFASAFPFEETPDQLQAIDAVFADMTSTKPMDRVICGDVGFGKTEVALRAAFLAVMNNKQVALLVPTTLLAQQHFNTFQDRFADWPVKVELLSRFRTAKEQKETLQKMQDGKVDIVIGTHKLLQSDIKFNALGLVIVDEEHRFGVKQKERLKALRSMVDILTLTATPIPRTLNMSLSGIRDLSLIATPPARRLSVKTFVHEYSENIIQEAILRELMRGGQVYFLHNDISTINKKAEEISKIVGEARVTVAHGQMHERDLERIMSEFYHRHFNVLVCSTIIESGIDIPTANTIIINRADKLGIAQLHQLRGRVGRSHHQAYAYLFTPPKENISSDAKKRMDAIAAFDDLGIGFTLATHDLEIRGAGELLGEEQSGDMQEVGFTLYMDMLSRAVDSLKNGLEPDLEKSLLEHRTEIDMHISALIPEDYLRDVQLRLVFYKKIANAKLVSELDDIQVEMIDRFGLLPTPLKNLFAMTELKLKADALGIVKIDANATGGKIEFNEKPQVKPETIIRLIQEKSQRFKLDGATRIRFKLNPHDANDRINLVEQLIQELSS